MAERKEAVRRAAEAHSDLNVFAAITTILEGGHIYNSDEVTLRSVDRILKICRDQQQRCLREYDLACALASKGQKS